VKVSKNACYSGGRTAHMEITTIIIAWLSTNYLQSYKMKVIDANLQTFHLKDSVYHA
jgi:hypothetical protein